MTPPPDSTPDSTPDTDNWRRYATALADRLRADGDLTDPAWFGPVARTPRHLLVPQVWQQNRHFGWEPVDTTGPDGLALVYSPETLITKVDPRGWAISSSTMPDLMLRMLELLDIHDQHTVLEIGTGTGYNAALLSHRLGDDQVVSVDVDPELVDLARSRLASFDAYPTLVCTDGQHGYPDAAPYDRILATCSVPAVPWAWAEQLRDGGRILVSVMPDGVAGSMVLLDKHPDRLEGRFTRRVGRFMAIRHHPNQATTHRTTPTRGDEEPHQRPTAAPAEPWNDAPVAWLWAILALPGLSQGYTLDDHGAFADSLVTAPDGSQATITRHADNRTVTETGPTPIWTTIENAHDLWCSTGKPGWDRLGMTVTPQGQTIWLDEPTGQRWHLGSR